MFELQQRVEEPPQTLQASCPPPSFCLGSLFSTADAQNLLDSRAGGMSGSLDGLTVLLIHSQLQQAFRTGGLPPESSPPLSGGSLLLKHFT